MTLIAIVMITVTVIITQQYTNAEMIIAIRLNIVTIMRNHKNHSNAVATTLNENNSNNTAKKNSN